MERQRERGRVGGREGGEGGREGREGWRDGDHYILKQ